MARKLQNKRHELFCNFFVWGSGRPPVDFEELLTPEELAELPAQTMDNAGMSYLAAGYKSPAGNGIYASGSRLLRRRDIQLRVQELRDEKVETEGTGRLRWGELVPIAHRAIRRALTGKDERLRLAAAKIVVDRDEGPLAFRFRDDRTGEEKTGYPVLLVGFDDSDKLPEP